MKPSPYLAGLILALMTACSADSALSEAPYDMAGSDTGFAGEAAPPTDASDGDGFADTGAPEVESDFLRLLPAQTDVYVFIANPTRNTVTRVNVYSMDVQTVSVGRDPIAVQTTPDYSTAVAFNRGDDSVSLIDSETLVTRTIEVRDNFNRLVMGPSGEWVAVFHDINAERPDDPRPTGLQSFNEVSFVNVATGEHTAMAVGFNPREVQFTPDGSLAVVISDEYLAVIDLFDEPLRPQMIQVAEDLLNPPKAEEVLITPNGDWAFVRQFGAQDLTIVDLIGKTVDRVQVGANPTDIDISPDGTKAVVVSRGDQELWVFNTADPVSIAPEIIGLPEGERLGSLLFAPNGQTAMLYTTATQTDRYATWDLQTDEITLRSLIKPVKSMSITPTGNSALIFHSIEDAPDGPANSPFRNAWAITMLDLTDFRSNPLKLPAEPTGYAHSTDGTMGFFIMDNQPYLEVLHYDALLYDQYTLRSNPVYLGVLPDLDTGDGLQPPAWISQNHPLGRLSFFDPNEAALQTITGFELNSQIEE